VYKSITTIMNWLVVRAMIIIYALTYFHIYQLESI